MGPVGSIQHSPGNRPRCLTFFHFAVVKVVDCFAYNNPQPSPKGLELFRFPCRNRQGINRRFGIALMFKLLHKKVYNTSTYGFLVRCIHPDASAFISYLWMCISHSSGFLRSSELFLIQLAKRCERNCRKTFLLQVMVAWYPESFTIHHENGKR